MIDWKTSAIELNGKKIPSSGLVDLLDIFILVLFLIAMLIYFLFYLLFIFNKWNLFINIYFILFEKKIDTVLQIQTGIVHMSSMAQCYF